jgi:hypothetical protein
MTWTEKNAYNERVRTQTSIIQEKIAFLKSDASVNGVANNDRPSMEARTKAIQDTEAALEELSNIQAELKTKLNTALTEQTASVANSETLRTEIQKIQADLEKSRELNRIRKEQAESLHTKFVGNLHSSWLGLWTPLSDETRVAIVVITIALFCCIFAVLGFLIVGNYISVPWKTSYMGGSRVKTRTLVR